MATVAVVGTCDTKLNELLYLRDRIQDNSDVSAILIDVGWRATKHEAITLSQQDLVRGFGHDADATNLPRGKFIELISLCATKAVGKLFEDGKIHGVVSAGGSGGTSIASAIMRNAVPIGFPKLIASTIASGDTVPIVGETDIMLMSSVVDVAGLNQVLRNVLANAGAAIAAAASSYLKRKNVATEEKSASSKKRIGITMFGVTTPGVDAIRSHLESTYPVETYVYHATGQGGKAMERLIREGELDGVIDLTTTEICDFVMGGVMSAGEGRLDAAVEAGIPNIISLGATDMANFGARNTVPDRYKDRAIVEHNPIVTLVRSSPEDCKEIGDFISRKLKNAKRPDAVQVWIPKGGVSVLSVPGQPFEDRDADTELFKSVKDGLQGSGVRVVEDERDINDGGFARDLAEALAEKLGLKSH